MLPDPDVCYPALAARDARFDGRWFVGVSTTGVYCRPVCRAKTPGRKSCTFYPSAAAAEAAGFRPCLRCRPELAPGLAPVDAPARLAATVMQWIETGEAAEDRLPQLAERLGVTDRHLRRVVQAQFGVAPVALLQTQRLLTAKRLITETNLPLIDVAFASGFGSVRRFNALFVSKYRIQPGAMRRGVGGKTPAGADTFSCELGYRPPLDWGAMLAFLGARAVKGVEQVEDGVYRRAVKLGASEGWFEVAPVAERAALRVTLAMSLAPVVRQVLAGVRRVFDLAADPVAIAAGLGGLAAGRPGLRVPGAFDSYETATRALLGQQISVKAATTLAGRWAGWFGERVETPFAGLTHATPRAGAVAKAAPEELVALGILRSRAEALIGLARAVSEGTLRLELGVDPERTIARLMELPGIGEWTAHYLAMRTMGWPDAFPHTDLGVMKALGERRPKAVLALAERWRPWRAYATMHLWSGAGGGGVGKVTQ